MCREFCLCYCYPVFFLLLHTSSVISWPWYTNLSTCSSYYLVYHLCAPPLFYFSSHSAILFFFTKSTILCRSLSTYVISKSLSFNPNTFSLECQLGEALLWCRGWIIVWTLHLFVLETLETLHHLQVWLLQIVAGIFIVLVILPLICDGDQKPFRNWLNGFVYLKIFNISVMWLISLMVRARSEHSKAFFRWWVTLNE